MQTTLIDQLPEAKELADGDRIIINQEDTGRASLGRVKEYMQGDLPERIDNAISEVKEYTDQLLSGRNEWLPPVNAVSELKTAGLDNKINYLCKVIADAHSGVYQAVAGWTASPKWALFDDTVDLVNEQELAAGINNHDASGASHNEIRLAITTEARLRAEAVDNEAQARHQQITSAVDQEVADRNAAIGAHNTSHESHDDIRAIITNETQERQSEDQNLQTQINNENQERAQGDIDTLNNSKEYADQKAEELNAADQDLQVQIDNEIQARAQEDANTLNNAKVYTDQEAAYLNYILDGVGAIKLSGALLTRVIFGTTPVAKNLFDPSTVFVEDKTFISDINGTFGVCKEQNSATVLVETLSIAPMSSNEPTLLGNVSSFSRLPLTVEDAVQNGWNTPRIDDYARVLNDETNGNKTVEWYIADIDGGEITWANPVIINTGDYQAQTTAQDAGKVLIGGASPGTHGQSKSIDTEPTEDSDNLINSNAVYALMRQVFLLSHPVGNIYMTVSEDEDTAEKMHNKHGGTWAAWGQGRVPVGVSDSGTFNTVEKTGGAETHTLTGGEMPAHRHDLKNSTDGTGATITSHGHAFSGDFHAHTQAPHGHGVIGGIYGVEGFNTVIGGSVTKSPGTGMPLQAVSIVSATPAINQEAAGGSNAVQNMSVANNGSGNAHNNLQPYITCYMWKRTA